jgi:cell division protein FtsB
VSQASAIQDRAGLSRPSRRVHKHAAPPQMHLGRLALLVLILIGASFYVSPLRDFFAQQDRYQKEAATLQAARAENAAFTHEAQLLSTKAYIAQRARADSMLVPPGTMVFVVKGLPGKDQGAATTPLPAPTEGSISVLDRLDDLWRTLLR